MRQSHGVGGWVGAERANKFRAACGIQLDEGGKKAICDTFLPCVPFACPLSPLLATPSIAISLSRFAIVLLVCRLTFAIPVVLTIGAHAHWAECILSN